MKKIYQNCNRFGKWKKKESHRCFVKNCNNIIFPNKSPTCLSCNWKICNNGHCGYTTSEETRKTLSKFYDLFCEPHNYSNETKYALKIMIETFVNNCIGCLE